MPTTIASDSQSAAAPVRIGVDVGGTKLSVVALDRAGQALFQTQRPTPQEDYPGFIAAIVDLVATARAAAGPAGAGAPVGVGAPGELDAFDDTVKNANSVWLIGRPLLRDLTAALGQAPRIANDAQCFVASEVEDGAAQGAAVAFGVILGTGVGGGVAFNGRPWRGVNRLAGEWGHAPLPVRGAPPGRVRCYCGRENCIESWLSGPALSAQYAALAAGRTARPTEIAALAAAGDGAAQAALDAYLQRLAQALAMVVSVLDPDVIVLGGGVSGIDALYAALPARVTAEMFHAGAGPPRLATRIVKNRWGADSGVRGAARLWP